MRASFVFASGLAVAAVLVVAATAQQDAGFTNEAEARAALIDARQQGSEARARAEALERMAAQAGAEADRTARQAAAAAARIQEAQAEVAARQADIALIDKQREGLRAELAQRQLPVARLTGALERFARRPVIFGLLRPGSLRDTVHMRAMFDTMLPQVQRRTVALRGDIARSKVLKTRAEDALVALKTERAELATRHEALAALETRQRLAMRNTSSSADREAENALALAEQARDLDALTTELNRAGALRSQLMQLPGPVMRPGEGQTVSMPEADPSTTESSTATAPSFIVPVQGRLVAGFGATIAGAGQSRGMALAASPGAQAIAPGAGRIAFAGPYRGYGMIVIIDHGQGWTSLVTGLVRLDAHVGETVVTGSPLGVAGPGRPVVSLELRHDGVPVNPLDVIKAQ